MKTTLKKLEMKGLRSFVEPTSISLPENGLLLLMGPSGSGKSSLFLGISHALGFCPFPASELQSWLGDEKLEVKLDLGTKSGDVKVVRGPKSFVEGAVNVQGASNINSTVAKLTGLNQELLAALTYRPQKTPGLFLSKTNGEMQEFLSILLGLNKFDRAIEVSQDEIKRISAAYELQKAGVSYDKDRLDKANSQSAPFPILAQPFEEQCESAFAILGTASRAHDEAQANYKAHVDAWKKKKVKFELQADQIRQTIGPKPSTPLGSHDLDVAVAFERAAGERLTRLQAQDRVRVEGVRAQIKTKNQELRKFAVERQEADRLNTELSKVYGEQTSLSAQKCPKCEQRWANDRALKALDETETRIEAIRKRMTELANVEEDYDKTEQEVFALEKQLSVDPRIQEMLEICTEAAKTTANEKYKLKQMEADRDHEYELLIQKALADVIRLENDALKRHTVEQNALAEVARLCNKERENASFAYHDAGNALDNVRRDNEYVVKEIERIKKDKDEAKARYDGSLKCLEKHERELKEEQDLLELLKAFLTAIFDEVLEEIAANANEMMAVVPNISHVTIKFQTEMTTGKGTTKRSITPLVNVGGGERPLRSALSGGMASAVELAVDLSVRKVISARSGHIPGWLILDECFEGLGVADKEACLDLLKRASDRTLIMVIDHTSETKELFNQVIEIENVNGKSRIK